MTRKKAVTEKFSSKDCELSLTCEWGQCAAKCDNAKDFTDHVTKHINDVIASGGTNGAMQDDSSYMCLWNDCMHHIEGGQLELKRHVYFHTFHSKLKSLGMAFIAKGKLNACMQGANNRNIIPDLPERFHCGWSNCEMICDNPDFFYSHVRSHSEDYPPGKKVSVSCKCLWQGCEATFKQRYTLQVHLRSHTQEKAIACPTCGGLFSNMSKFKDHLLRQDENLRTYQCSHCSKCYQNERLLRDHMRKHVSNYKCPFCEMTVASPSQLKMHIKFRHTDDAHFVCKVCSKGFKTERDMERHERAVHSSLYHYCQYTGCTFKCKHNFQMNSHIRFEHKNEIPQYACHMCSSVYTRGRTLTLHLMRHHGFRWMPGHRKFKYNLNEDGVYRLQTVRYESYELSQQMREEGLRKALNSAETEARNDGAQNNAEGNMTGSDDEAEDEYGSDEGSPRNSSPLDLSSPTSSTSGRETRGGRGASRRASRMADKSGRNNAPNSMEMSWTSYGEHTKTGRNTRSGNGNKKSNSTKCKTRKSLEDAINNLRNSPQKTSPCSPEMTEGNSREGVSTRTRKRKEQFHPQIAPPKKKARRRRVRSDSEESDTRYELAAWAEITDFANAPAPSPFRSSDIPNQPEASKINDKISIHGSYENPNQGPGSVSVGYRTDYVPSPQERQAIEQLRVASCTTDVENSNNLPNNPENTCRLVTVGGQVIFVETNVPGEAFLPSEDLGNGSYGNGVKNANGGYGEIPEGAVVIARGEAMK